MRRAVLSITALFSIRQAPNRPRTPCRSGTACRPRARCSRHRFAMVAAGSIGASERQQARTLRPRETRRRGDDELEPVRARGSVLAGDVALGDAVSQPDHTARLVRLLPLGVLGDLGTYARGNHHDAGACVSAAALAQSARPAGATTRRARSWCSRPRRSGVSRTRPRCTSSPRRRARRRSSPRRAPRRAAARR